ncbi:MAG: acyl-CoA carboxylase biotin carboxyl carrier protein subunit [Candidatus Xenobia bacterium]
MARALHLSLAGSPLVLHATVTPEGVQLEAEQAQVVALGRDRGVLFHQGHVFPWYATRQGARLCIWMRGRTWDVELLPEHASGAPVAMQTSGEVVSPMPGSIVKVLVAEGDEVAAHQPLVIMESMKMELTVSAPMAGRVVKVSCQPGQLVDMNAALARVEPA